MPMGYSIYKPDTGEIVCSGSCSEPADIALQVDAWLDCYVLPEDVPGTTHYVVAGAPQERPQVEVPQGYYGIDADGEQEVTFPVPVGTKVRLNGGAWQECDDGVFEFATDVPGEYVFDVRPPFPYVEASFTLTAEAST